MFRRKYSRRPTYRRGRKYAGKGYRKTRIPKSVKRYVSKAIHRNIENKENISYAANQTISTSIGTSAYSFPLINSFPSGTLNHERVANQLKCVGGKLNLMINLLKYNSVTNPNIGPFWVKIWIVRTLFQAEQEFTLPNSDSFFKTNGANIGFQGMTLDMVLPVNTDRFRVLTSRMFKIGGTNTNQPNVTATSSFNPVQYADMSPMGKHIQINWTKYVRKQLKFTDDINNCQNDNLYFVAQVVPCDGTTNSTYSSAEIHYTNTMLYEDA